MTLRVIPMSLLRKLTELSCKTISSLPATDRLLFLSVFKIGIDPAGAFFLTYAPKYAIIIV